MDPQGTVHRCLLIPEIINLICREVNVDYHSRRRLRALAALARTCRLFQEPAFDLLWSELSTIGPLVKCMPSDLWREEPVTERSSKLLISRPIKPSDWSRFLLHAPRVRKFHSGYRFNPRVGLQVYQALSIAAGTTVLLPNVQDLSWFPEDESTLPYVSLFFGRNIITMRLSIRNCGVVGLSLLPTLCSRFPSIRSFKLFGEDGTTAAAESLSPTLCGWTQLHSLELGQMTYSALMHIGKLPYLTNLTCLLVHDSMPASFPSSPDSPWFPILTYISIRSDDLTACSFLVESLSSSPISSFALSHTDSSDSLGWKRLLNTMRDHCNRFTLASVRMVDTDDDALGLDADVLTVGNIRPLFVFSRLGSVDLCPREGIDLDDTDMMELAKAWPLLSSLSLNTSCTADQKPRVTLAGLIPLAKHCPKLSVISINVNACDVDIPKSRPGNGIDNEGLEVLAIGSSPIGDPMPVAAFLSDIFPEVTEIYGFDGQELDASSKWREVGQLIPTFVSIRSQERNYGSGDGTSR